jgi:hypothetical protein
MHKSDSNQLLVSLVVEHGRRATPPLEGETETSRVASLEPAERLGEVSEHFEAEEQETFLTVKNDEVCKPNRRSERILSASRHARTPSPEPEVCGSPKAFAGTIGTCFVSGIILDERTARGISQHSPAEQYSGEISGRPFRREVTAADSKITISGENLTSISFEQLRSLPSLASLIEISIASNKLQTVDLRPVASCRSLQVLLLNDNLLDSIDLTPLATCTQLERLWIHRNKLKNIDLSPLAIGGSALRSLYLGRNELEEINLGPLENCSRLRALQLDGNMKLKEIDVTPLFACSELSSFEAPPHARLIVREFAALEAQRRSMETRQNMHKEGQTPENQHAGNFFPNKLVLPKVFRKRGIVLHWIREIPSDSLLPDGSAAGATVGHSIDGESLEPRKAFTMDEEKISPEAPSTEFTNPCEKQREHLTLRNPDSSTGSLEQQPRLTVMVIGMTTHRRISTCKLLEHGGAFRVVQTSSVSSAIDAMISSSDEIDLILMEPADFEVFIERAHTNRIHPNAPVVVVGPPECERGGAFQRCVARGAKGFISFPLDGRDARALRDVATNSQASRRGKSPNLGEFQESEKYSHRFGIESGHSLNQHRLSLIDSANISDPSKTSAGNAEENKWVPEWRRDHKVENQHGNSIRGIAKDRMDTFLQNPVEAEQAIAESSALQFIQNAGLTANSTRSRALHPGNRSGSFLSESMEWSRIEAIFADRDHRSSREPCFQWLLLEQFCTTEKLAGQPSPSHTAGMDRFVDIAAACQLPRSAAPVLFLRVLAEQEYDTTSLSNSFPSVEIFEQDQSNFFAKCMSRTVHADTFYWFYRHKIVLARSPIERFYSILALPWPGADLNLNSKECCERKRGSKTQQRKVRYVSRNTILLLVQEMLYRRYLNGKQCDGSTSNLARALSNQIPGMPRRYSYHGKRFLSSSSSSAGETNLIPNDAHSSASQYSMPMSLNDNQLGPDLSELLLSASIVSTCVWFHLGGGNRTYVPLSNLRKARFAEAIYAAERGIIVDMLMEMLTGSGVALVARKELETAWNYQLRNSDSPKKSWLYAAGRDLNPESELHAQGKFMGSVDSSYLPQVEKWNRGSRSHRIPLNRHTPIAFAEYLFCRSVLQKYRISREAAECYFLDRGTLMPRAVERVLERFQRCSASHRAAKLSRPETENERLREVMDTENQVPSRHEESALSTEDDALSPTAFVHLFLALCDPGSEKAMDTFFDIMDLDMDGYVSRADVAHFYQEKCDISLKEGLVLTPATHLWAQLLDMCRTAQSNTEISPRGITLRMLRDIGERRRSNLIRNVLFKDDGMALVDIQQTLRLESSLAVPSQDPPLEL